MHCTLPRKPSRSASDAITWRLSPRIMRLVQLARAGRTRSWRSSLGKPIEVGEEIDLIVRSLLRRAALRRSRSSIRTLGWTFSWM